MGKVVIKHQATAGTAESSDIQIVIDGNDNGVDINLVSSVENQFGKQIRKVIRETLDHLGVENAKIVAVDKGALDCTIVARVTAAVMRSADQNKDYDWEALDTWNA